MRLILIPVFALISSAISVDEKDNSNQRVVHERYNFNHPPWAENDNPIPVAVVYEDNKIAGKAILLEVEQKPEESQTTEVNDEPVTTQRIKLSRTVKQSVTDSEQDDILVKPKARTLVEHNIPVAVVYDSVPEQTQNSQQAKASNTKNGRRYKLLRRRQQQSKTSVKHEEEPVIENTESAKLLSQTETKNVESVKPQRRQTEFTIPQSQSGNQKPIEPSSTKQGKRVRDPIVPIVYEENYVFSHSGNFHYSYEGGDGTKAHSEGRLNRNSEDEAAGEAVSGGFSYTDKEGNDFSLTYTADENGYRPIGAHLPTPPPIPPAIARALAYLATVTTPEPVTKPSVKQNNETSKKPSNTRLN